MLALTLPLYILLSLQFVIGLLLLTPVYLAKPAIALAKLSKTPIGLTILGTISVFLGVLLIPPLVEINIINRHASRHASELELSSRRCETVSDDVPSCLDHLIAPPAPSVHHGKATAKLTHVLFFPGSQKQAHI